MRILYLAPDPVPLAKGAGVRIVRTLKTLLSLGHEVRLFSPASPQGRLDFLPHDAVELPQENFLEKMLALRRAAAGWLDGQEADLVQFRGLWEGAAAAAWARRRKAEAVWECHGFPSIELPYHYPALEDAPALLDKLAAEESALLAACDRIVTHSSTGRRFLLMRGVAAVKVSVVPNCADPEVFKPAPVPPADEAPWRLVYVGTLAPWQGLPCLLEALSLGRKARPVELHVIGPRKGAWHAELRALARRLRVADRLKVSGATAQEDLVPALQSAHVCVAPMPSDVRNTVQGCCPIKVLEYMAAGRPILATAIPPLRELLEHGQDAYLARPQSPAALAQGLSWLLEDAARREELGRKAREKFLTRWTPGRFREDLAAVYDDSAVPMEVTP